MKKITTLFFSLVLALVVFAQEKRIDFTNKFTYQSITKKNNDNQQFILSLEVFANNNEGLLLTRPKNNDYYPSQSFFYDEEGFSWVNFGINNHLIYNPQYEMSFDINKETKPNYEVTNLNTKEKVGDYTCNQYLLKYKNQNSNNDVDGVENSDSHSSLKVCIDDRNTINNSNLFFIMTNYYGMNANSKNFFPKGLVVKLGDEKDYDTEYTMLVKVEKNLQTVYFDRKKAVGKEMKYRDSIKIAEAKYQENKGIAEATRDSAKEVDEAASAVVDAAKAAAGAVAEASPALGDYEMTKYESTYKKQQETYLNPDHWTGKKEVLPGYCFQIKKDVPNLGNIETKKHLKNYVEQICDMYYTEFGDMSMMKTTLDEIRREGLWLLKNREMLDKKDQKLLDTYLDSLD